MTFMHTSMNCRDQLAYKLPFCDKNFKAQVRTVTFMALWDSLDLYLLTVVISFHKLFMEDGLMETHHHCWISRTMLN